MQSPRVMEFLLLFENPRRGEHCDTPLFIVSYIEVARGSEAKAADLIKKQSAASKSEAGSLRFDSLQRIGRKNLFVVLEDWSDPAARNNHAKAAYTVAYR